MGPVFVDTSAFYPLLVRDDPDHVLARETIESLHEEDAGLVTTNYVVQETVALLQSRWGVDAVRSWRDRVEPMLRVVWIDEEVHRRALVALLAAGRRSVSLTDWSSFEVIRQEAIPRAFAFDRHFGGHGFEVLPG